MILIEYRFLHKCYEGSFLYQKMDLSHENCNNKAYFSTNMRKKHRLPLGGRMLTINH